MVLASSHRYEVPPLAVRTVLPPVQKLNIPEIEAVGKAFTVTVFEQEEVQPLFVTVNVTV